MGIIFSSFNGLEAKLPYIKFSTSQWQQKNFSDLFTILSNNTHSRAELTNYGTIRNIHYGDVLIKFGNILDTSQAEIPYLCENCKYKDEYMQDGDIIIADTAEDYTAGKCTELFNVGTSKIISGLHTIPCRPKIKFAQKYLGYYTNSPAYRHQLLSLLQGIKVYSISKTNLSNTHVSYPPLPEQQKIADFLSLVDQRIEKQRQLVESLKKYKRGLLSAIFDKISSTSTLTLGEICNITTGKLDANAMVVGGKYRFYTCAREYFEIDTYAFDTDALLISGNGANVGYIHHYCGKFNAYQRTYVLDGFQENIMYIYYYLQANLHPRIEAEKKAGNTPYIVLSTLSDMLIKLPAKERQNNIAKIFAILDKKIMVENDVLERLNTQKQGLLQQMFI